MDVCLMAPGVGVLFRSHLDSAIGHYSLLKIRLLNMEDREKMKLLWFPFTSFFSVHNISQAVDLVLQNTGL